MPPSSSHPVVLIWEDCLGLAFSASFIVVRADRSVLLPEVLWAMLNSSSGRVERRRRSEVSSGSRSADVLDLEVPVPPLADQQRIAVAVAPLRIEARPTEGAIRESWWKTAALHDEKNWSYLMSGKVPVDLTAGTPLGDLAEIAQGRKRLETFDRPEANLVPLILHRDFVRGADPAGWVEPSPSLARSGDIILSQINAASNARVTDREHAVGAHLLIIRPRDKRDTDRILAALNSEHGRAARAALATGITLASLTLAGARRLPVADIPSAAPTPVAPLHDTLERLVWQ